MRQFMPVLIQVDGDQRASSHPSPHSHLWFHQICNRTPHGGSLIHPLKHQGQNPFLQSKCVLKISSLTAALEKFACIYMFIKHGKMSSSNLSWSDPIILTEKICCVMRYSPSSELETKKVDGPRSGYSQVLLNRMNVCITLHRHPQGQGCLALNTI